MPKSKSLINLLPQEEFDASIVGRILKWAMGTFRIIVIVTEMVVMAAFLSRFWLDAQNSDLTDAIKIKTAQIAAQSDLETQFRNLQNKLNVFKLLDQGKTPTDRLEAIASKVPPDVTISTMSIEDSETSVKGSSTSELGVAQFISNIKNDTNFKGVQIGSISSSEENQNLTVFTLKILY